MIYPFITQHKPKNLSVRRACFSLFVSPSGYFKYLKSKVKNQDVDKQRSQEVVRVFYLHEGKYGYRKVSAYLRRDTEVFCSPDQARRILKGQGLKAKTTKSFKPVTTLSAAKEPVCERVFQAGEAEVKALNQVWGSDITYLPAKGGSFLYLAIFLDFCSRKIIGWDLSRSLSALGVLRAFYRALKTRSVASGLIIHSDRGVQYTAKEFRDKLKELGFIQSFSRKGNCYDNSYCESCFSLLKRELGYKVYENLEEARGDIFEWIEAWYNTQRLHSSLGYKSPVEFEKTMRLNRKYLLF